MAKNLTTFVKSLGGGSGASEFMPADTRDAYIYDATSWSYHDCACNYGLQTHSWCVPPGISQATFHIWGAGGPGAAVAPCGVTVPSGSGAYAYKSISVTPGDCYNLTVGIFWCCCNNPSTGATWAEAPIQNSGGNWGSYGKSYVTGTGLTNFCAEGGFSGNTVCCTDTNYTTTLFDSATAYYGLSPNDSAGGPFRACFYGADGGLRGRKGYLSHNGLGVAAHCNFRGWVPLPNCSVFGKCGGHVMTLACCNQHQPNDIWRHLMANTNQGYCNGDNNNQAQNWEMSGSGSSWGVSCGGSCYCGGRHGSGKARVIFS
tara:strand:+ start:3047 stop:3991 length:945 start_codon:yes stop_codon:yes gene_type:complete